MTVDFCDYFWGEKNNGFDVLYQNTKHGQNASKELADFFKESALLEESYSKMQAKLASKANSAGVSGTFAPVWTLLRTSSERLSSIHLAAVTRLAELVKEVQKFTDDLHKRQKTVKEEEAPTMEVVQSLQQLTASVLKAREVYHQRAAELRRLQEAAQPAKDTDKAEAKLRKAAEEYRALVDKHRGVRDDFERKMVVSCRHFQELEENYLCQMKEFIDIYIKLFDASCNQIREVNVDLRRQCDEKTVLKLLEEFALAKHTGLEKPAWLEFEELPAASSTSVGSTPDAVSESGSAGVDETRSAAGAAAKQGDLSSWQPQGTSWTSGFLRGRRKREKQSKSKRDNEKSDSEENHKSSPVVDEEGFSIRPRHETEKKKRHDSFYSSSDSDSDEDPTSKIHVKINPLSNGGGPISASVDELRTLASGLTLSPANTGSLRRPRHLNVGCLAQSKSPTIAEENSGLRRSQSQQLSQERPSNDLIGLSFHSPTHSNQSTPSGSGPRHLPSAAPPAGDGDRYAELSEIFAESSDMPPALPPKHQAPAAAPQRGATPTLSSIAIPRPPSRRSVEGVATMTRGRQSPALSSPVSRGPTPAPATAPSPSPSAASGSGTPRAEPVVGSSRGPSPLTLGLSDTVPLAVAFQEVVHAYFRGSDPSNIACHPVSSSPSVCGMQAPCHPTMARSCNNHHQYHHHHHHYHHYHHYYQYPHQHHPETEYRPPHELLSPAPYQCHHIGTVPLHPPSPPPYQCHTTGALPPYPPSYQCHSTGTPPPHPPSPAGALPPHPTSPSPPLPLRASPAVPPVFWPDVLRPDSCHNPWYALVAGAAARPAPEPIPVAILFSEVANVHFQRDGTDNRCRVRMTGDTMVSFPSGIVQVLTSNPSPAPLVFRLKNTGRMENMLPNRHLITQELKLSGIDTAVFEFRMDNLTALLRRQAEKNPSASYFNVDILKYEILAKPGAASVPLQLVAYWKCEPTHTDLKVEYKYNSAALTPASALQNITVSAPVDGGVTAMHSKPTGKWVVETNRAMWRLQEVSPASSDQGAGALKARFELSGGPGSPSTLAAQFSCEGSTLSGAEFQLLGSGYRVSLVKRRFVSGKYLCDSDYVESSERYAAPPGPG
ncbi:F-BAR domain only protein 2-like isoform X4 [Amphibalanus amphitrite]|uniref:F-BAR domain only protein 2-like isoform X4 n=1 Tax=Amphibalanus amphitrite TaxID=1232801 RepID=UPI001C904C51|nr:F-BAR domain only protein 2-like isoform X4 [Amphibalanus amphitrite]